AEVHRKINLKRSIKEAKTTYKRKLEDHFSNNDPWQVWQGIQHLSNHKTRSCTTVKGDASLVEELDRFLGTHISEDLYWTTNAMAVVKKAQQRLYFLRIIRKNNLQEKLLGSYYCSTI
ncbi:hypothetical protein NFI96_025601, partial [Prochilodus magdalenae]